MDEEGTATTHELETSLVETGALLASVTRDYLKLREALEHIEMTAANALGANGRMAFNHFQSIQSVAREVLAETGHKAG